jgi:two-component system, OmpR family, heavy metal sensor histidine kinase CusS
MSSLRRRLLFGTGLGVVIVLCLAGVSLYALMRASLWSEFDRSLRQQGKSLLNLIEQQGDRLDLEFEESQEFTQQKRPDYFQIWSEERESLIKSARLFEDNLPRLAPQTIESAILPDGRPGRVLTLQFQPAIDDEEPINKDFGDLSFSLARDTLDTDKTLRSLIPMLALVGLLTTLAALGVLAWLIPLGLRPASRLAREIRALDEEKLSFRMSLETVPSELQPIVLQLNELLVRLEAAFVREKNQTADISHELRTPFAGLRSMIEVALSLERSPSSYQETLHDCLLVCKQSQGLIESLLTLYRIDSINDAVSKQRIEISSLLQEVWRPLQRQAEEKNITVTWNIEESITVESSADKLRLVLTNILENAAHYTPPQGKISIEASAHERGLRVQVTNTGSRLNPKDAEHVFERFWRSDQARESDGHYGLGLALCKAIMVHLGGAISVKIEPESFSVKVIL